MTTISAPRIRSTPADADTNPVVHGVHVRCQTDMPYLVALCGTHVAWDDEDPSRNELCVVCLDLKRCPVCGAPLIRRRRPL